MEVLKTALLMGVANRREVLTNLLVLINKAIKSKGCLPGKLIPKNTLTKEHLIKKINFMAKVSNC